MSETLTPSRFWRFFGKSSKTIDTTGFQTFLSLFRNNSSKLITDLMAIAASLFFSSNTEKQTLHRRIVPSDEQMEFQKNCWNDLADYLRTDLKEASGYSIRTWLQGSYKFATQLRPLALEEEFDIDLGIYFEWQGLPSDGDFSPLQLKEMVQKSLECYTDNCADAKEVAQPKTRCNRIHYQKDFHIDTPTYHLDASHDARALATEDDEWEDSDPKAIYIWFKEQIDEDIRSCVRRLIRYLKAWAVLNIDQGRPSAILLTVLVAECYQHLSDAEAANDDDALAGILQLILERLEQNREVCNPVNTAEILSDRLSDDEFSIFIEHLQQFCDLAKRAVAADTEIQAAVLWSEVYHHFFPLPEESQIASFTETRKDGQMVSVFKPRVGVTARRKLTYRGEWFDLNQPSEWSDVNRIGPIPLNCSINFKLLNPEQLPYGAQVQWTVRNEGTEAEAINDLGHMKGTGHEAEERSAYRGRHYMDCVVWQFGNIVTVKRIPVDIK